MELRREAVLPAGAQQLLVVKEEVPLEQQEWSSSLDQEDPEPPHIKEEQEEVWTSQEGEQLQGLEEADITKFPFTPVPVKSENDEEKPQSSQLHQRLTEQIGTEADGEDCGGSEPARNSDSDSPLQSDTDDKTSDSSEPETEKYWRDPNRKPFRCSVCAKTFKHRGNLNIHMRTHTGVKPFSCSLCNKSFTQKAGLDYHLKVHTGEKPFSCSVCGKRFRLKGAVTSHMATHTGVKPFSCSVCNKRFRGASQLKVHKCVGEYTWLHISQSDKHKKPLSCAECDATFPNNYLLVTHMRMHKGKKLFTCSVCGQKRQFSSHLDIHMRTHTGERPYSCSICGKRFSQRGIMSQHMAVHSGVKPFSCTVCDRRFYWHFQVKKHKCLGASLQRKRTVFTGEDCGGSEPVSPDPERHLQPPDANKKTKPTHEPDDSVDIEFWKDTRQHQTGFTYRRNKKASVNDGYNTGEKAFSCSDDKAEAEPKTGDNVDDDFSQQTRQPQSSPNHLNTEEVSVSNRRSNTDKKPFSSSDDGHTLQIHQKSPTGEKTFSCLFSGKEFAAGGYLTRHTSVYTGEKPLNCIINEKRFTLESQLLSHECVESSRVDIANKLMSSSQCGKGFNRKHQLPVPLRVHTGLRPFGCSVCGKTFAKRESLRSHMSCHRGKEPFRCSVCNTGFSDSESLVQHMRIHTRQTQFSCTICGKEFAWRRYLTKHMEVHSKEKTYSCRYCEKTFPWHYQLKYHQCVGHQSSQLDQTQTEENREAEPPASKSTEQMETETDGEDCGGPEPTRYSDPDTHLQPDTAEKTGDSSEPETDYSDDSDFWKESCGHLSILSSVRHDEVPQSDKTFNSNQPLKIHRRSHTEEEQFTERGGLSQHMAKQEDPEPQHIKEEQEELWISQEGEQLQGLEEAEITKFTFTPVPVKSEDDEEKPQSSQLHKRLPEQMETEADGEDCGGPEPDTVVKTADSSETETVESDDDFWKETREPQSALSLFKSNEISDSIMGCKSGNKALSSCDVRMSECPDPETDDSVDSDFWKDNRKPPTGLNSLNEEVEINEVPESEMGYNDLRKPYSCPECGKRFLHNYNMKNHMKYHTGEKAFLCSVCGLKCLYKSHLEIHMRTHTREKPFPCPVCGKKYAHKASMQSHMAVHTVEKRYCCSVCDKGFAWFTELKYHQCVGESSYENTYGAETT